jgi:hypothetical protein
MGPLFAAESIMTNLTVGLILGLGKRHKSVPALGDGKRGDMENAYVLLEEELDYA